MFHLMCPLTPDSTVADAAHGFYFHEKPVLATATGRCVKLYSLRSEPSQLLYAGIDLPLPNEVLAVGFLQPDIQEDKDVLIAMDSTGDVYQFMHLESTGFTDIKKIFNAEDWSGVKPSKSLFSVYRQHGTLGIVSGLNRVTIFKTQFGLVPQHYRFSGLPISNIKILEDGTVAVLQPNRDYRPSGSLCLTNFQIYTLSQDKEEIKPVGSSSIDLDETYMDTSEPQDSTSNKVPSTPSEGQKCQIDYHQATLVWERNLIGHYESWFVNNINIGGYVLFGTTKIAVVPTDILGRSNRYQPEMITIPYSGKVTSTAEVRNKRIVSTSSGEVFLVTFLHTYDSDPTIPIPMNNIRFDCIGIFTRATVLVPLGDDLIFLGSDSGDCGLYQLTEWDRRPHLSQLQVIENIGPIRDATTLQYFDRLQVITASGRGKDSSLRVIENAIYPIPLNGAKVEDNIIAIFPLKLANDPKSIDKMILLVNDSSTKLFRLQGIQWRSLEVLGFLSDKTLAAKDIFRDQSAIQVTEKALNLVSIGDRTKKVLRQDLKLSIVQAVINGDEVYTIMENGQIQIWVAERDDSGQYKFVQKPAPRVASPATCIDVVNLDDKGKFLVCAFSHEIRVLKTGTLQEYAQIPLDESIGIPTSLVATGEDLFIATIGSVFKINEFDLLNKSASGFTVVSKHSGLTLQHFDTNGFLFAACDKTCKKEGFLVEKNLGSYSFPAFSSRTVCRIDTLVLRGYPIVLHADSKYTSVKHLSRNKRKIELGEDVRRIANQDLTESFAIILAHKLPIPAHQQNMIQISESNCIDVERRGGRKEDMDAKWTSETHKDVFTVMFFDNHFFVPFSKIRFGPFEYAYNIAAGSFTKFPNTPVYAISIGLQYEEKENNVMGYIAIFKVLYDESANRKYVKLFCTYEHSQPGKPTLLGFRDGTLVAGFGESSFIIEMKEFGHLETPKEFPPNQAIPQLFRKESNEDLQPGTISTSQLDLVESPPEGFRRDELPLPLKVATIETLSNCHIRGMSYRKSIKVFEVTMDGGHQLVEPELFHSDFYIGCTINTLRHTSYLHLFYMSPENTISSGSSLFFGTNTGYGGWVMHLNHEWSTVLKLVEKAYDHTSDKNDLQRRYEIRFANRKAKNPSGNFVDGEKLSVLMSMDKSDVLRILKTLRAVDRNAETSLGKFQISNASQLYDELEAWLAKIRLHSMCDNMQAICVALQNIVHHKKGQPVLVPRVV